MRRGGNRERFYPDRNTSGAPNPTVMAGLDPVICPVTLPPTVTRLSWVDGRVQPGHGDSSQVGNARSKRGACRNCAPAAGLVGMRGRKPAPGTQDIRGTTRRALGIYSDVQNGKPRSYRLEFSTNREATTVAGILRRSSASTLWSPIAAPQSTRPVRPSRPNTCPDRLHPRALTRPRPRTRSGAGSLPLALERFQALTSGQPPSFRGRQASSAGVVVITLATSQGCLLSAGVFAWNR